MINTLSSDQRLDWIELILDTLVSNQINKRDSQLELKKNLEILYQTVLLAAERIERAINALAFEQKATTIRYQSTHSNDGAVCPKCRMRTDSSVLHDRTQFRQILGISLKSTF